MHKQDNHQLKRAKRQVAIAQSYKQVFGTPEGKRVLNDILKHAHVIEPSYIRGDAHETSYREGERNMALRLLAMLNIDIQELQKRIQEGEQEE